MGREGAVFELEYLVTYMALTVGGNQSFSDRNSSCLSSTQKAEVFVDSGAKVLSSLVAKPLCSAQIQRLLLQAIHGWVC